MTPNNQKRNRRIIKQATGNHRLPDLYSRAEILHINYYELKSELSATRIGEDIEYMAELLAIFYPLTGLEPTG